MLKTTINYEIWVHSIPDDVRKPLPPEGEYLREMSDLYEFLVASRLIWKVWMIDEFGLPWIRVHRMGPDQKPREETLRPNDGTFEKIEVNPYEVEAEQSVPPS
jgi:hypothetical protein